MRTVAALAVLLVAVGGLVGVAGWDTVLAFGIVWGTLLRALPGPADR